MRNVTYTFSVPGQPVPKARPRHSKFGVYTPKKTADYEKLVGWTYKQAGYPCFSEPVQIEVIFYRGDKRAVDVDNLLKSIQDGLNGIAYDDDSLIYRIVAEKQYDKANPRAVVSISRYFPPTP